MPILSTGQFTIVDLYDVPAINAWISSSLTSAQTYNNTAASWSPNYPTSPFQVLTLNLTKAGSATSLLGADVPSITWYKILGGTKSIISSITTTDNEFKSGTSSSIMTTKINIPTANNAVIYGVEGVWNDPVSGQQVAFGTDITLTLVQLAKAAIISNIYAPDGDFFKNDTPASLTINCDLYKDGTISAGSKLVKWFASDSSVGTVGHASYDADGGIGWRKITVTTGTTGEVANVSFNGALTSTQAVLTVYPNAVINAQTFLSVITDNVGGTSGTKVRNYLTIRDMDDPVQVVVESTGGNILKNGLGSTTLLARVFQNGNELDAGGSIYTYKWYKWENNVQVPNFGGAGVHFKTGKSLAVGSNDVNVTSTFKVEVNT